MESEINSIGNSFDRNDEIEELNKEINININEKASKLDILIFNNGWNDKNEILAVRIGEKAIAYKWMHDKCANKDALISKLISIIIIVLNSILSVGTIFNISELNCTAPHDPILIFQKIIVWLVSVIYIVQNLLKYNQLEQKHKHYSTLFSDLYFDIQQQMSMYRKDRLNAVKYVKYIYKKYDLYEQNGPDIDNKFYNDFKKKYENQNMPLPDSINRIDIIQENDHNNQIQNKNNDVVINMKQPSNLTQITNLLKIDGDLSENEDIPSQLLKNKAKKAKEDYEMVRFDEHNIV
jgi:hypothetical protein